MPTDKIARLRELERYAAGESSEFIKARRDAFPHLLAIAEAAKELKREEENPYPDYALIRVRQTQLFDRLTAFEESA